MWSSTTATRDDVILRATCRAGGWRVRWRHGQAWSAALTRPDPTTEGTHATIGPLAALIASSTHLPALTALAQDATTSGTVTTPHPTIENFSVKWSFTGDDNQNGVVSLRFREEGESAWRTGLALRRVPAGSSEGFSWENQHAGSVFDLSPDTTYEIELSLVDPDGGDTTQVVPASTRPIPDAAADANERPATPATFASALAAAVPGDIVLLADGTYPEFGLERSGTADDPVVIRAENRGGAVVNGEIGLIGPS
jgi:hypothetical protein